MITRNCQCDYYFYRILDDWNGINLLSDQNAALSEAMENTSVELNCTTLIESSTHTAKKKKQIHRTVCISKLAKRGMETQKMLVEKYAPID